MTRRKLQLSLFVLVSLAAWSLVFGAQNYPTVAYKDAADHLDEIVWVEGTILKTENAPEGVYLVFNANEKYVRLLIPKANVSTFEGSIQYKYTGKKVKAVGKVAKYGHLLIVGVNEPKRIKILDEEAT